MRAVFRELQSKIRQRAPPPSSEDPPRRAPLPSSSGLPGQCDVSSSIGRVGGAFGRALGEGPRGRALQFSGRGGGRRPRDPGLRSGPGSPGTRPTSGDRVRVGRRTSRPSPRRRGRGRARGTEDEGRERRRPDAERDFGPRFRRTGSIGTPPEGPDEALPRRRRSGPGSSPGEEGAQVLARRRSPLDLSRWGRKPANERPVVSAAPSEPPRPESCPDGVVVPRRAGERPTVPPTGARTNSRPFAKKDQTERPGSGQRGNRPDRQEWRGRKLYGV
ncbi:hypothetical protein THAOC_26273 [Thalassiosira oceanica]|uniref:Uncharacterized protein n=1 Tax=Thalassiosira oceanica TaxID=159749 RepID=K0S5L5_THAOC|nr:hypothetical protein THAOC_26273 [Thalassiosira oceanica]|eukprot:EJK54162.1 hypothetical protein THAOC_26273 [Thalassiosira oceanica]